MSTKEKTPKTEPTTEPVTTTLICQEAFRLELDGLALEIARGTRVVITGGVTRIFDMEISNPKLITKLGEAKKAGWLKDGND